MPEAPPNSLIDLLPPASQLTWEELSALRERNEPARVPLESDGRSRSNNYADRTVVRSRHFGPDERALEPGAKPLRDQEIVDPPPHVALAHAGLRAPPGVPAAAGLELAEGVEEAGLHEGAEAGPLLGREAVVPDVGFRAGEIELRMGDVEIAADDHGLPAVQIPQKAEKSAIPAPAIVQAGELPLRIRDIDVHEEKTGILERQDPSLPIMGSDADADRVPERPRPGEDGRPGIAFPRRIIPERHVSVGPDGIDVVRAAAGLLEADHVGILFFEISEEILAQDGPESVDVPRNELHRTMIHEIGCGAGVRVR